MTSKSNNADTAKYPMTMSGQGFPIHEIDEKPFVKDVDLGAWLGMAQPLDIRRTIAKNERRLSAEGPIRTECEIVIIGSGAKREVKVHYLNEYQVLQLTLLSRTPKDQGFPDQLTDLFRAWRQTMLTTEEKPEPLQKSAAEMMLELYADDRELPESRNENHYAVTADALGKPVVYLHWDNRQDTAAMIWTHGEHGVIDSRALARFLSVDHGDLLGEIDAETKARGSWRNEHVAVTANGAASGNEVMVLRRSAVILMVLRLMDAKLAPPDIDRRMTILLDGFEAISERCLTSFGQPKTLGSDPANGRPIKRFFKTLTEMTSALLGR